MKSSWFASTPRPTRISTKGRKAFWITRWRMAGQITGARVYHINTAGGYNYKYSDHDAVLVGLNLGKQQQGEDLDDVSTTAPAHKVLRNGQLYIEIDGQTFTITGIRIR